MKKEKQFAFALRERVELIESGETGEVIGRAEYTSSVDHFFIRYRAGDGRQVEAWWGVDALKAA